MSNTRQCTGCHGLGWINGADCPACDGLGREVTEGAGQCPRYRPDLQAQGDCINCGRAYEYHNKGGANAHG